FIAAFARWKNSSASSLNSGVHNFAKKPLVALFTASGTVCRDLSKPRRFLNAPPPRPTRLTWEINERGSSAADLAMREKTQYPGIECGNQEIRKRTRFDSPFALLSPFLIS
ncbi:MAG: hypothetical protein ACAH89_10740, partial [Rariglobus sp.]